MSYSKILMLLAMTLFSVISQAEFDDSNCERNASLEITEIQCVSCGIQKFYADKGQEVLPSDRFLTMLAAGARSFRNINSEGARTLSTTRADNLRKVLISQVQAYGFCQRASGVSRGGDIPARDTAAVNQLINNRQDPSPDAIGEIAKKFGFEGSGMLGIGGRAQARDNMKFVLDDLEIETQSIADRRRNFRERSADAIAGSRIQSGPEGEFLRSCLTDMRNRQTQSDADTRQLCRVMSQACGVQLPANCNGGLPAPTGGAARPGGGPPRPTGGAGTGR